MYDTIQKEVFAIAWTSFRELAPYPTKSVIKGRISG
jgi:hypothetical protein